MLSDISPNMPLSRAAVISLKGVGYTVAVALSIDSNVKKDGGRFPAGLVNDSIPETTLCALSEAVSVLEQRGNMRPPRS
jgi:hypothetical protein